MQKYGYFTTLAKKSKTFLEINENIWAPKKMGKSSYLSIFFHTFATEGWFYKLRFYLQISWDGFKNHPEIA